MEEKIIGTLSPEALAVLKANHGKITEVRVTDGEDVHVCYFKRPSWDVIAATQKLAKTDEVNATKSLFSSCWVGGSDEVQRDALLALAASSQLSTMMQSIKSEAKNA